MLPLVLLLLAQWPPTFRSDVQLVTVDVEVAERGTGKVIDGLGPRDFVILDEGEPREIRVFQVEAVPLDVVFLHYTKGLVASRNDVEQIAAGMESAARELRPGDRAAVLRSDSSRNADLTMTGDLGEVERVLTMPLFRRKAPGIGDRLFDAVRAAAELFPKPRDPARRRAIFLTTDDIERKSKTKLDALIAQLLEASATLDAAILVTEQPSGRFEGATLPIPRIPSRQSRRLGGGTPSGKSVLPAVEATGGDTIPGDKFREEFPRMLRRLRSRYLLGFYVPPSEARVFRTLRIALSEQARGRYSGALIRARSGYYSQPR
jgi:VWFA-related protein